MAVITFKCSDSEKEAFQNYCDKKGVSISVELRNLINSASGNEPEKIDIHTLHERLNALETKFQSLSNESVSKPKKQRSVTPIDPDQELITIEQAEALTGYAGSTIRGKVQAVRRKGKKGLYSQSEILEKIGTK